MRLIDADTLLKQFNNTNCGKAAKSIINNAPTIDAAPVKRGKREYHLMTYGPYKQRFLKCSVCGEFIYHKDNFCPNCGAKMEDA